MKNIFIFLILMNNLFCATAQNRLFTTAKLSRIKQTSRTDSNAQINDDTFYKIVLLGKSVGASLDYETALEHNIYAKIDTLKAIEELLSFEGDERLCVLTILKYNYRSSNFWKEQNKNYSLQVEALYLINQITLKDPFLYAPIPALKELPSHNRAAISGDIISNAFRAYRNWFEVVKKQGLQKTLSEHYYPLDNSTIFWY